MSTEILNRTFARADTEERVSSDTFYSNCAVFITAVVLVVAGVALMFIPQLGVLGAICLTFGAGGFGWLGSQSSAKAV